MHPAVRCIEFLPRGKARQTHFVDRARRSAIGWRVGWYTYFGPARTRRHSPLRPRDARCAVPGTPRDPVVRRKCSVNHRMATCRGRRKSSAFRRLETIASCSARFPEAQQRRWQRWRLSYKATARGCRPCGG